jgi:hypothetical protein
MPEQNIANGYRQEAVLVREAVQKIQDEGFCQQLLNIADQYEAAADMIEAELPNHQPIAA